MTTVINNPGNNEGSGGATGLIVGIIALIIVVALFFVYVLPMIRNSPGPKDNSINVKVTLPDVTPTPATN